MPSGITLLLPACLVAILTAIFTIGLLTRFLSNFRFVTGVHIVAVSLKQLEVFLNLSHPFLKLGLVQVWQVSFGHFGPVKGQGHVTVDQWIERSVFVDFDEVVIKLRNDSQSYKVKHEIVGAFCDVRQVPQVDNFDQHDYYHVDQTHKERSQWVGKVVFVHGNVLHHLYRAANLSLELEMEQNCTNEFYQNDCALL